MRAQRQTRTFLDFGEILTKDFRIRLPLVSAIKLQSFQGQIGVGRGLFRWLFLTNKNKRLANLLRPRLCQLQHV